MPSRSSHVSNWPDGGLTQYFALLAQARRPGRLTSASAASRVASTEVGGITAAVGVGRPAASDSSRIFSTRARNVASVIRPGIQPSQYSTARRADAGVAPQYQNGGGPPTGLGSIVTSSNA